MLTCATASAATGCNVGSWSMKIWFAALFLLSSQQLWAGSETVSTRENALADRMARARAAAASSVKAAESRSGNPQAPELVGADGIPGLDELRTQFKIAPDHMKPEFFKNMEAPVEGKSLQEAGCSIESTIPVGLEVEPGRLTGTATLFSCPNGSYGRLNVTRRVAGAGAYSDRVPSTYNEKIGQTPAVGRYQRTSTGVTRSILGWDNPQGEMIGLELISAPPSPSDGESSQDQAVKNLAAAMLKSK